MTENDISSKIKDLRAKQKLTLEEIARYVGVGRRTVRKWETGQIKNMRRDKIQKLAEALHTSPEYLMGWSNDPMLPLPYNSLTSSEAVLLETFRNLNTDGQALVLANARMLANMPDYIK